MQHAFMPDSSARSVAPPHAVPAGSVQRRPTPARCVAGTLWWTLPGASTSRQTAWRISTRINRYTRCLKISNCRRSAQPEYIAVSQRGYHSLIIFHGCYIASVGSRSVLCTMSWLSPLLSNFLSTRRSFLMPWQQSPKSYPVYKHSCKHCRRCSQHTSATVMCAAGWVD